mmetsp:Transcript_102993/g.296592  ORF Transcript_102993/g.296592 Transcript_102993/m.296592 type:complete len:138 (-) Transcript_102993:2382-2795(-)
MVWRLQCPSFAEQLLDPLRITSPPVCRFRCWTAQCLKIERPALMESLSGPLLLSSQEARLTIPPRIVRRRLSEHELILFSTMIRETGGKSTGSANCSGHGGRAARIVKFIPLTVAMAPRGPPDDLTLTVYADQISGM